MENCTVFASFEGGQGINTGIFRSERTAEGESGPVATNDTAPLQTACAEGRHYACGAKVCSCDCHKTANTTTRKGPIFVVFGLVVALVVMVAFTWNKSSKHTAELRSQLNQSAVKVATYLLVQDVEVGLTNEQSAIGQASGQELLMWARLDEKATAPEYEAAYDNNEISADNQYKGKKILVSGTVARIEKDFTGGGNIWFTGSGLLGVHAELDDRGTAAAASFNRDQRVNLVCVGGGRLVTVATLTSCEPLDSYLTGISPIIASQIESFLSGQLQLPRVTAEMVISAYVVGLYLPSGSPCMQSKEEKCSAELDDLVKNKSTRQAIKSRTQAMLASLKVK